MEKSQKIWIKQKIFLKAFVRISLRFSWLSPFCLSVYVIVFFSISTPFPVSFRYRFQSRFRDFENGDEVCGKTRRARDPNFYTDERKTYKFWRRRALNFVRWPEIAGFLCKRWFIFFLTNFILYGKFSQKFVQDMVSIRSRVFAI